jgi:hypothetical protein
MLFQGGFSFANFLMDVATDLRVRGLVLAAYYHGERPVSTSGRFRLG